MLACVACTDCNVRCGAGEGCRSRTFAPVRSSAVCTNWQKVRLQELVGADKQAEGQVRGAVGLGWAGLGGRGCIGLVGGREEGGSWQAACGLPASSTNAAGNSICSAQARAARLWPCAAPGGSALVHGVAELPLSLYEQAPPLHGPGVHACAQVPRTIEVELQGPLIHTCMVGDIVTITGLVKVRACACAAAHVLACLQWGPWSLPDACSAGRASGFRPGLLLWVGAHTCVQSNGLWSVACT